MKKEIEITFEKYENNSKNNVLNVHILLNTNKIADLYIWNDETIASEDSYIIESFLGSIDFNELMKIPEIKKLYDEHFNKRVDLFGFIEKQAEYFFCDEFGIVHEYPINIYNSQHIEGLKKKYNIFPTRLTCENASEMSLDERKEYLFMIAKGYEVLMRKDVAHSDNHHSLYFDATYWNWVVLSNSSDGTQNIHFKTLDHARECADWMNGSEVK